MELLKKRVETDGIAGLQEDSDGRWISIGKPYECIKFSSETHPIGVFTKKSSWNLQNGSEKPNYIFDGLIEVKIPWGVLKGLEHLHDHKYKDLNMFRWFGNPWIDTEEIDSPWEYYVRLLILMSGSWSLEALESRPLRNKYFGTSSWHVEWVWCFSYKD